MQYEHLRQWRDICELLDKQWYKFLDQCYPNDLGFTLLLPSSQQHRQELWANYMIQLVQFGQHPHAYHHHRSEYRKDYGWRLLPDWEIKIDFLEQIVLFNRNPDDLPQPWRRAIWEAFFRKRDRELNREQMLEEQRLRLQERKEKFEQKLRDGDCPANFSCQFMSGALVAGQCPNFDQCRRLAGSL